MKPSGLPGPVKGEGNRSWVLLLPPGPAKEEGRYLPNWKRSPPQAGAEGLAGSRPGRRSPAEGEEGPHRKERWLGPKLPEEGAVCCPSGRPERRAPSPKGSGVPGPWGRLDRARAPKPGEVGRKRRSRPSKIGKTAGRSWETPHVRIARRGLILTTSLGGGTTFFRTSPRPRAPLKQGVPGVPRTRTEGDIYWRGPRRKR